MANSGFRGWANGQLQPEFLNSITMHAMIAKKIIQDKADSGEEIKMTELKSSNQVIKDAIEMHTKYGESKDFVKEVDPRDLSKVSKLGR
jgi:hypothetical protein